MVKRDRHGEASTERGAESPSGGHVAKKARKGSRTKQKKDKESKGSNPYERSKHDEAPMDTDLANVHDMENAKQDIPDRNGLWQSTTWEELSRRADGDAVSPEHDAQKDAAQAARRLEKAERKMRKAAKKEAKKQAKTLSKPATASTPSHEINGHSIKRPQSRSSLTSLEPAPAHNSISQPTYMEHPDLTAVSQKEIDHYMFTRSISISDPASPPSSFRPITAFSYLPVMNRLQGTNFQAFKSPTPIQAAAWPFLFDGRDVVGVAETGSGKTLAFAVPCVRYVLSIRENQGLKTKGAIAVIVSPTRELAIQIYEQIVKIAGPVGLKVTCVYGGVAKDEQRNSLKTADIVVATPGRLNDFVNEGAANLSNVGYQVLDEADRMLDKGFEQEIRKIINTAPPTRHRQTVMFTATWPPSVRELASTFMQSPVRISIGDNSGDLRANTSIVQEIEVIDPRQKEQRLLELLRQYKRGPQKDERILVFCLYKKEATRIENFIRSKGFQVVGIHGDLSQSQRLASLDAFKSGRSPLLVATDVAARGLDIPAVRLVINVTFPLTVQDYVHRIGRTGRAGNQGTAITLFTDHDKALAGALINVLKAAHQTVPDALLKFGTTVKKKTHDAYGAFYKETSDGATKTATKIKFD